VTATSSVAANVDVAVPVHDLAVADLVAQASLSSVAVGVGLWMRSDPTPGPAVPGPHTVGGVRLGVNVGTGDAFGLVPFALPYAGVSLLGQIAVLSERGHVLSGSVGVDLQSPQGERELGATAGGTEIVANAALWGHLDLNGEIVLADPVAVVVGAGMNGLVFGDDAPIPTLSAGLRFRVSSGPPARAPSGGGSCGRSRPAGCPGAPRGRPRGRR
jgi:hypothetical protein